MSQPPAEIACGHRLRVYPWVRTRSARIPPFAIGVSRMSHSRLAAARQGASYSASSEGAASFFFMLERMSPATVGMRLTRMMAMTSSSKCFCTNGMPPKK